ncbi:Unknown protein sequence [Pseudomonas syringae pv. maculicola]|nr:Unknown protein sequence [Pseudomonas syringae pv. maculicola]
MNRPWRLAMFFLCQRCGPLHKHVESGTVGVLQIEWERT